MRYLTVFACLFFLIPKNSSSQDIFPNQSDQQKWEYVTWYFWGGKCESRVIITGEVVNKCDQDYIEIFDCNENERNCLLIGYYRVQNDSVLIRTNYPYLNGSLDTVLCEEGEGLAYDFSARENDTLMCQMNSTFPPKPTKFWKIGEELIEYEGIERRTLQMNYIPYRNAPQIVYRMKWIEGIGSDIHPFYSLSCIGDHCELEQQMTKVIRNEEVIYLDTMLTFSFPCTGWITSNEEVYSNQRNYRVFPNPTTTELSIGGSIGSRDLADIRVFNSLGELVLEVEDHVIGEKINISKLKNGLYFIELIVPGYQQLIKVVKN